MEEKKQKGPAFFVWTFIIIAFLGVIVILLDNFFVKSRLSAVESSKENLLSYVDIWSESVKIEIESAINYGNILESVVEESKSDSDLLSSKVIYDGKLYSSYLYSYMQAVMDNTDISHIYIYKDGKVVCNDRRAHDDFDFSAFNESDKEVSVLVTDDTPYKDGTYLVFKVPFKTDNDFCALFVNLSDAERHIAGREFSDVSFLALTDADGHKVGIFGSFQDKDSNFLIEDNIFDSIKKSVPADKYNVFENKIAKNGSTTIEASLNGDSRTISVSDVGINGLKLVYGVRQSAVESLAETKFKPVRNNAVKLITVLAIFSVFMATTNIVNSYRSRERGRDLEDKADTDLLTELNNKAATERKIAEYIEENPTGRALLFILDIDNFKKINDTMGHAFGDTLLKTLGKEISAEFRVSDIIGRTGGDEFMVFLKDVNDDIIVQREVNRITRFFQDFKAGGDYVKYSATASIGAAVFPDDAKNFKDLYVAADSALYRAKKRGKNQLVFFNEDSKIHG